MVIKIIANRSSDILLFYILHFAAHCPVVAIRCMRRKKFREFFSCLYEQASIIFESIIGCPVGVIGYFFLQECEQRFLCSFSITKAGIPIVGDLVLKWCFAGCCF